MIRGEGLAKRFIRQAPLVLHDVCLEASAGEAVHIRGANGSGKTTLLRLLAGVTRPTAGVVERRPGATGWSPVDPIGGSALSARTLLAAAARTHGAGSGPRDIITRLGLDGHADQRLGTRSAGTRRKVNVAFALAAPDPALLILDEPWAGLDATAGATLTAIIEERCRAGSCVVFSDHGHAAALPAGTRPVELHGGTLRAGGTDARRMRIDATRRGEDRIVVVDPVRIAPALTELLDDGWSVVGVDQV